MTGTDYNAIVNDRNRSSQTVRPKAQPNHSHAIGAERPRGHIQTGNGADAHLYPYNRRRDEQYILESERDNITRRKRAGIEANFKGKKNASIQPKN